MGRHPAMTHAGLYAVYVYSSDRDSIIHSTLIV